jgi:hypothetical protein
MARSSCAPRFRVPALARREVPLALGEVRTSPVRTPFGALARNLAVVALGHPWPSRGGQKNTHQALAVSQDLLV